MNKIILLLGDLASGKSTYSHMLGDRYKCLVLNKDTIKEYLADTIGFSNREENKKLSKGTFKIMSYVFEMAAKTNQNIILEANFHEDELELLYKQIQDLNYQSLTCVFEADLDILFDRFIKRSKEHRHPVHLTSDLLDINSFKNYMLLQRKITPQGKIIKINANDFSYQKEEHFEVFDKFINS